jgi:prephenate dehydrogenase
MTDTDETRAASATPFGRVAIIGLGLMGGSLGLALRAAHADRNAGRNAPGPLVSAVAGYDAAAGVAERAVARGALDLVCATAAEAVRAADLVVIATPALAAEQTLRAVAAHLAPDVVVTDLCSVKAPLVRLASQALAYPQRFVGGHPMAGLERAGIEGATAELYHGARWALTPTPLTAPDALQRLRALVVALGAEPLEMDAEAHDAAVAGVSHLPMLLATALTQTLAEADDWPAMAALAAGGYRDTTRVAAGDPVMWRDIALTNRTALLARLDAFTATLAHLRALIAAGDAAQIEAALREAQTARLAWEATHQRDA